MKLSKRKKKEYIVTSISAKDAHYPNRNKYLGREIVKGHIRPSKLGGNWLTGSIELVRESNQSNNTTIFFFAFKSNNNKKLLKKYGV